MCKKLIHAAFSALCFVGIVITVESCKKLGGAFDITLVLPYTILLCIALLFRRYLEESVVVLVASIIFLMTLGIALYEPLNSGKGSPFLFWGIEISEYILLAVIVLPYGADCARTANNEIIEGTR